MAPSKKEVAKKEVAVVGSSNAVAVIDAAQVSYQPFSSLDTRGNS